jgi:hypothetical protein
MFINRLMAVCVLVAAQQAVADVTILSVSRIETTRSVASVTAYGISQGFSSYDNSTTTLQVNAVPAFNFGTNILNTSEINVFSDTTAGFSRGNLYSYFGSFTTDAVSIQFEVSAPQPYSFTYPLPASGDDTEYMNLSGPGLSIPSGNAPPPSFIYSYSGVLAAGTYTLTGRWGMPATGAYSPQDAYPDQSVTTTLLFPEPAAMGGAVGIVLLALRRR